VFCRDGSGVPGDPPADGSRLGPFADAHVWECEVIWDICLYVGIVAVMAAIVWIVETYYKDRS